jgi:hypothetical protein
MFMIIYRLYALSRILEHIPPVIRLQERKPRALLPAPLHPIVQTRREQGDRILILRSLCPRDRSLQARVMGHEDPDVIARVEALELFDRVVVEDGVRVDGVGGCRGEKEGISILGGFDQRFGEWEVGCGTHESRMVFSVTSEEDEGGRVH